jgi:hypothetical protein
MNNDVKILINSFVPFVMLGIAVSLIIGLVIMFSYVLVWGIFIGVILWAAASIKDYFFPNAMAPNKMILRRRIIEYRNDTNDEK